MLLMNNRINDDELLIFDEYHDNNSIYDAIKKGINLKLVLANRPFFGIFGGCLFIAILY